MSSVKSLRELAFRHVGPLITALLLAAVSIVPVAWSLLDLRPDMWYWSYLPYPARTQSQALLLAASAVVPAALLGGYLGGLVHRQRPMIGALVALALSWPIGITMLPLAATILNLPMQDPVFCFDTCTPQLVSGEPLSGLEAYLYWTFGGLYALMPAGIAIVLLVVATVIARKGHPTLATPFAVAAYASLHIFTLLPWQAHAAFACLGLGVILWAAWLNARGRHLAARDAADQPTDVAHTPPAALPQPGRP